VILIDTHLHPLADDLARYPVAPISGEQSAWSKGMHLTADEIVQHLAAAGVDQATLVQASTVHGYDNRYCADCCARYPELFVGVCCIDPRLPDAPATLSAWFERGMRGVRLFTLGNASGAQAEAASAQGRWLDDPRTEPVWARAEELGIPVAVQVSMAGLDMVRSMLARFPRVPLILDHLAGPTLADGPPYREAEPLLALSAFPNLFLKLTTVTVRAVSEGRSDPAAFFGTLLARFGAARLLWGSNFPATRGSAAGPYTELVEEAREALAFLSAVEQEQIFAGTALSLYPALRAA